MRAPHADLMVLAPRAGGRVVGGRGRSLEGMLAGDPDIPIDGDLRQERLGSPLHRAHHSITRLAAARG